MKKENLNILWNKLPVYMQKALKINIDILNNLDYDSAATNNIVKYIAGCKIVFYDWEEDSSFSKPCVWAYFDSRETLDFYKENEDGVFNICAKLLERMNVFMRVKIGIKDELLEKHFTTIKVLLSNHASNLSASHIAKKAEEKIKQGKTIEAILKNRSTFRQSNKLTKSGFKCDITPTQKKLLNFLIWKAQIEEDKDKDNCLNVSVSTSELKNLGFGSNQTIIKKNLLKLMKDTIMCIEIQQSWAYYNVFRFMRRDEKYGSNINVAFSIEFSSLIDRLATSSNYTMLSVEKLNKIKRYSTMKMYELCCQYRNSDAQCVYLDDAVLRVMLNCSDKYQDPDAFKRHVLDVAQQELHQMSLDREIDLYFTYKELKKTDTIEMYGKKRKAVEKWAFVIHRSRGYVSETSRQAPTSVRIENAIYEAKILFDENIPDKTDKYVDMIMTLDSEKLISCVKDLREELLFGDKETSIDLTLKKYGVLRGV